MALKFFNSLSRQKADFQALNPPSVSFYTCGPTVYDTPHLGNLRTFVTSDLARRVLERFNFSVRQIVNITDIDDKIIAASRTTGQSLKDLTAHYEQTFLADLSALNILRPTALPRATEFVDHMIVMIKQLLKRGVAYSAADGIYFRISSFPNYGQLKPLTSESEDGEKESGDFALWKFYKPEDGEAVWDASFGRGPNQTGRGRPGWHIECSAMIAAALDEQIDLHLGGTDLIFPHHENENAQTESLTGKPLARFWLHSAFITIEKQKMAKSLGNVVRLVDLTAKKITPLAYRYLLLTVHYRTLLNFTWESLASAARAYEKLRGSIRGWTDKKTDGQITGAINVNYRKLFDQALEDDLNLPQALAVVWKLVKDQKIKRRDKLATLLDFDRVLGLDLIDAAKIEEIPEKIKKLAAERERTRQAGDWALADALRQEIKNLGYHLEDSSTGPKIRRI